jgi:alpha-L-arabinofuranosidase
LAGISVNVFPLLATQGFEYHGLLMMRLLVSVSVLFFAISVNVALSQTPTLTIHADQPTTKVSPMLYGLMTEEINFSYDGGLYAELIRDRTIGPGRRPLFHWTQIALGNSTVDISVDDKTGPSEALPRSMKVVVTAASETAPAGIQNDGFWGMAVQPKTTYTGSIYAKADTDGVPVTVSLVNDATGTVAATATVTGLTTGWKRQAICDPDDLERQDSERDQLNHAP